MRRHARAHGFTMVELIVVMILIGVLAAIGIPRLVGDNTTQAAVFGDQVVSGLRRAQKIATGHRRVVCATVGPRAVTLRLNACGAAGLALTGLADDEYATTTTALSATPMTLFFQPDGRITSDGAGNTPVQAQVAINVSGQAGAFRTILVQGATGYVE